MSTSHEVTPDITRVLLLGDVHGAGGWFKKAARTARDNDCQVILQLGDLGFWPHRPSGETFWKEIKEYCLHYGVECWWVEGNHENYDWLEAQPHHDNFWRDGPIVHCGRGARWEWSGVRFLSCGGAYSIDKGARIIHQSWWPQELITEEDVEECGGGPADILVSHDAPYGAKGVIGGETAGNKDMFPASTNNRLLLYKVWEQARPKLVLHGHYHHRNSTMLDETRVEGFHRDGNPGSIGILELPSMTVSDNYTQ